MKIRGQECIQAKTMRAVWIFVLKLSSDIAYGPNRHTTYGELLFVEQGLVDQSVIPERQNLDIYDYSVRSRGYSFLSKIDFPHAYSLANNICMICKRRVSALISARSVN